MAQCHIDGGRVKGIIHFHALAYGKSTAPRANYTSAHSPPPRQFADEHDMTIKEVVTRCLKFGLTAMKIHEDPDSAIYFREKIRTEQGATETKEIRIEFW